MTWAIIGAMAALLTLQSFWIGRLFDATNKRLDRIDGRLDHIEGSVLRDHGERIARLEARQ
jgi:hypothetical protein